MNNAVRDSLERHFDIAFAAPDGIKKLRKLILTLAMQGKLVAQDPNDPPASQLLKEIEAEKKRLVKEEGLRTEADEHILSKEEYLGRPTGWEYCRLGNLARFIDYRGRTPKKVNSGVPLITAKNIRFGFINREPYEFVTDDEYESWMTRGFPKIGDLLFTTEAPLGNIAVIDIHERFALAQRVICLQLHKPDMAHFLKWLIMSAPLQSQLLENATGMTATGIKSARLKEIPVPIPPLPEQHRIVAKIDQLMARCDELEKLRDEREQKRRNVHAAALKQLLEASLSSPPRRRGSSDLIELDSRLRGNDDSFAEAWQFITQHFGKLYAVCENVTELRKAILQLAVMGKLVPQDPNDPPASQLLKEIEAEKQRLHTSSSSPLRRGSSGLKDMDPRSPSTRGQACGDDGIKTKFVPPIKPEEVPYELPQGWEWVRVWNIAQLITSGSRDWAKYYAKSGAIFVTMGNLSRDNYQLRMDSIRYVSPPLNGEGSRTKLEENDLLISITGDVGNLGLIPSNFGEAYINQHTCLLRLMPNYRNRYFPELMRSPLAKKQFDAPQRGIKNSFRLNDVGEMIIPLPPLPEQHRIVAKIDQLMALCDKLEQQIDAATGKQTELLNAVMAAV